MQSPCQHAVPKKALKINKFVRGVMFAGQKTVPRCNNLLCQPDAVVTAIFHPSAVERSKIGIVLSDRMVLKFVSILEFNMLSCRHECGNHQN
jgi:hypothetical protein